MEQKPNLVYILTVLWIIIGILFLGSFIAYITDYFDNFSHMSIIRFYFASYLILFLFIVLSAFILAYGTFLKKSWSWITGVMLSSFLGYFAYSGIQLIWSLISMGNIDQLFANLYIGFHYTTYLLMIFFVPAILFILTRPVVKAYFGKT